MNNSKHTPGPWMAAEMGVIANGLTTHGNFYVCSLIDPNNEEDKANARLIAAAPDMLEALKLAYGRIKHDDDCDWRACNCTKMDLEKVIFDSIVKAESQ